MTNINHIIEIVGMSPFTITFTQKCSCGREMTFHRSFTKNDQYPTMPAMHRCPYCNLWFTVGYPPLGTIYTLSVNGINFIQNEYLVNPKLRKELYEGYQKRLREIKPIFGGLIKRNNLTNEEEFEYNLIKTNIKIFKERQERDELTEEEKGYLKMWKERE